MFVLKKAFNDSCNFSAESTHVDNSELPPGVLTGLLECDQCQKRFSDEGSLSVHNTIHSMEKIISGVTPNDESKVNSINHCFSQIFRSLDNGMKSASLSKQVKQRF